MTRQERVGLFFIFLLLNSVDIQTVAKTSRYTCLEYGVRKGWRSSIVIPLRLYPENMHDSGLI